MDNIAYERPASIDEALRLVQQPGSVFIGGGTNLLDLMKGGVARPARLVDVSRLPGREIAQLPDGGLRIGAGMPNSDTANHPLVRQRYPLLSKALLAGASPQRATWRPSAATCCSAPAAPTSATPASAPATSASRAPAARRAAA
jgi:xanthine dehydrogenase YagS FAD-binding subunit